MAASNIRHKHMDWTFSQQMRFCKGAKVTLILTLSYEGLTTTYIQTKCKIYEVYFSPTLLPFTTFAQWNTFRWQIISRECPAARFQRDFTCSSPSEHQFERDFTCSSTSEHQFQRDCLFLNFRTSVSKRFYQFHTLKTSISKRLAVPHLKNINFKDTLHVHHLQQINFKDTLYLFFTFKRSISKRLYLQNTNQLGRVQVPRLIMQVRLHTKIQHSLATPISFSPSSTKYFSKTGLTLHITSENNHWTQRIICTINTKWICRIKRKQLP